MGTSDFAVAVLRRLVESPHSPSLVVTRPDRPRGRGRKVQPPPVAQAARELGIEVFQPVSVNSDEARARIGAAQPYEVVICAFGALIKEPLLSEHPMLNVHPSLLPRWRGAAPVERAIMAGDSATGVTIHRTVEELDAGPMAAAERLPIGPDDDAGAIFARAGEAAVRLLDDVLPAPTFTPQSDEGVTYAEKITPADRELDWERPAQELHNRVRALSPHIGARGVVEGRRVLVWRTHVDDGRLELLEVQPEGKRRMTYEEFLRGLR
jgi:methionyl-tRNA formyltransferase